MKFEQLLLSNQLCFPVYAASRLIIREYQPYLDKLEITYPQYLVLLVLWEEDNQTVNDIAKKLILNTNTVTPLLKRMEELNLVTRKKAKEDERKVVVSLTLKGKQLQKEAADIPKQLTNNLVNDNISVNNLIELRDNLNSLINLLKERNDL